MHASATTAAPIAIGELRNECQMSPARKRANGPGAGVDTGMALIGMLGWGSSARVRLGLQRHPLEVHVIGRKLRERDVLVVGPSERLLMQRDVAEVVLVDLE